jgi:hypothetical protein
LVARDAGTLESPWISLSAITSFLPRARCSFFDQSCNFLQPRDVDGVAAWAVHLNGLILGPPVLPSPMIFEQSTSVRKSQG